MTVWQENLNVISTHKVFQEPSTAFSQQLGQRLPARRKPAQDYLVTPGQERLDGISAKTFGRTRATQFVISPVQQLPSNEASHAANEITSRLHFAVTPKRLASADETFDVMISCPSDFKLNLTVSNLTRNNTVRYLKAKIQCMAFLSFAIRLICSHNGAILDDGVSPIHIVRESADRAVKEKRLGDYGIPSRGQSLCLYAWPGGPNIIIKTPTHTGGLIQQTIAKDTEPPLEWDEENSYRFTVLLTNTAAFRRILCMNLPNQK